MNLVVIEAFFDQTFFSFRLCQSSRIRPAITEGLEQRSNLIFGSMRGGFKRNCRLDVHVPRRRRCEHNSALFVKTHAKCSLRRCKQNTKAVMCASSPDAIPLFSAPPTDVLAAAAGGAGAGAAIASVFILATAFARNLSSMQDFNPPRCVPECVACAL